MPKPPIVFSRCGSAGEVNTPVIGSGLVVIGSPTYQACKFGNGFFTDSDLNGIRLANYPGVLKFNDLSASRGCIEFWVKPNWDNTSNNTFSVFTGEGLLFHLSWLYTGDEMAWFLEYNYNFCVYKTMHGAGDLIHFALSWYPYPTNEFIVVFDFYVDGILRGNFSSDWEPGAPPTSNLFFGSSGGGGQPFNGTIDNLKIYDYDKTDFSDRFRERGGINEVRAMIL